MKIYHVYRESADPGRSDELVKSFASKEMAEKVMELYATHTAYEKEDFYVKEDELIDSLKHEIFHVNTVEMLSYDGKMLSERTLNTLEQDDFSPWGEFLRGEHRALDGFYVTYELVEEGSDIRKTVLNLHISRPKAIGEEGIEKEWRDIFQRVVTLHNEGKSQDEINGLLKANQTQS